MPRYDKKTKDAAKELFLKGYGAIRIAKELEIAGFSPCPDRNSVQIWLTKGKWARLRLKLSEKTDNKLVTTLAQMNKQHFHVAQKFIDAAVERLDKKELKADGSDAERMMKIQRLVFGEATDRIETNQFSWATAYGNLKKKPPINGCTIVEEKKE